MRKLTLDKLQEVNGGSTILGFGSVAAIRAALVAVGFLHHRAKVKDRRSQILSQLQ